MPDDRAAEPVGARNPAILYGLGNLLENAVDFAHERVDVVARWDDETIEVAISDDGPGFAPDILDRIGEPYVTSRRRKPGKAARRKQAKPEHPSEAVNTLLATFRTPAFTNVFRTAVIPKGAFRQDVARDPESREILLFDITCDCVPRRFE